MLFYYSDTFDLPLPQAHSFPGQKYGMLRQRLLDDGVLADHHLARSPLAKRGDLLRAHTAEYVGAIEDGSIDADRMRRIGFPWTAHLARRSRATTGGAVAAAATALRTGLSGQLAGGTHHAHANHGAGYCVFNDFAVVALKAVEEGWVDRVAIVDLDVHQGDGNAAILKSQPNIFVLSIHGANNFPFRKQPSDLDIALPDGTGDESYLDAVRGALPAVLAFQPGLVLYQAGVDPLSCDKLGRLALSFEGLMRRDELVLSAFKHHNIPVSMAIGGGYANPIVDTVTAYTNTYRVARAVHGF